MMGFKPLKRFAPMLANALCNPVSSIAREFKIDYHGFQYRGHTNNRIDWCVYFLKDFALAEGKLVKDIKSFIKRRDQPFVCMDIGASVGHRSLMMARYADDVIAIEPVRGACDRLREKVQENGLRHVRVFQTALDEETGRVDFETLSPANFQAVRKSDVQGDSVFGSETVTTYRGDDFIRKSRLPLPNFVRIDVGSDTKRVLKGLSETFQQTRPFILIVRSSAPLEQAFDAESLKSLLYDDVEIRSFHETSNDRLFKLETFDPDARKLVCIPKEVVRVAHQEGCKYQSHRISADVA